MSEDNGFTRSDCERLRIADGVSTRSIIKKIERQGRQMQAYMSLLHFLRPRSPFPCMDGAAIAPDLGLLLASQIVGRKPSLVVETGSGVSTLVIGYCLEQLNGGKLITIEHDLNYAEMIQNAVHMHGLTAFIEIMYAPLREITINDKVWLWYDVAFAEAFQPLSIDLLLIDGPPGRLGKLMRYPALPCLFEYLSDQALVIVDDVKRQDEREMVRLWIKEFPALKEGRVRNKKGTAILTKA